MHREAFSDFFNVFKFKNEEEIFAQNNEVKQEVSRASLPRTGAASSPGLDPRGQTEAS